MYTRPAVVAVVREILAGRDARGRADPVQTDNPLGRRIRPPAQMKSGKQSPSHTPQFRGSLNRSIHAEMPWPHKPGREDTGFSVGVGVGATQLHASSSICPLGHAGMQVSLA